MSIIIGIDHGYYAIKTAHCSFPARLTSYGEHEPCGCLSFTIFHYLSVSYSRFKRQISDKPQVTVL